MLLVTVSPSAIHGVDFSGAQDAGRRIWISSGLIDGSRLRIMRTRPVCELPGGSPSRGAALAALRSFVQGERGGAFGLDFPFGLPRAVVPEPTWKEFVLAFNGRYPSAEAFRAGCRGLSEQELRRATDYEAHTPWAAWNWRLYRQTYYGIGGVLAPLVREERVRVLPMEAPDGGLPSLLEICPASTLRRLGLAGLPYKRGSRMEGRAAREGILNGLIEDNGVALEPIPVERAAQDPGGDALDSILAAVAAYDAVSSNGLTTADANGRLEGRVYF